MSSSSAARSVRAEGELVQHHQPLGLARPLSVSVPKRPGEVVEGRLRLRLDLRCPLLGRVRSGPSWCSTTLWAHSAACRAWLTGQAGGRHVVEGCSCCCGHVRRENEILQHRLWPAHLLGRRLRPGRRAGGAYLRFRSALAVQLAQPRFLRKNALTPLRCPAQPKDELVLLRCTSVSEVPT